MSSAVELGRQRRDEPRHVADFALQQADPRVVARGRPARGEVLLADAVVRVEVLEDVVEVEEGDLRAARSYDHVTSSRTTRAGTPATSVRGGTERVTSDPAATIAPSPISTPLSTVARDAIQTRSPIRTGARGGSSSMRW